MYIDYKEEMVKVVQSKLVSWQAKEVSSLLIRMLVQIKSSIKRRFTQGQKKTDLWKVNDFLDVHFHLRVHLVSPWIAIPKDVHRREDGGDSEKNPEDRMLDLSTDGVG